MRIIELYQDYKVDFVTEGYKHCREGWVNTACPFCTGNPGHHLGYNIDENYYKCWRCGHKFPDQVISSLLGISYSKAKALINQYGGIAKGSKHTVKKAKVNLKPFKYPTGQLKYLPAHIKYLESRGFDPEQLTAEWGVTGTGLVAKVDEINYSKRILAPIMWDGTIVSFQTRSLSTDAEVKYMACPQERELIEHQTILYGKNFQKKMLCVEGITDVWKLGDRAFATFGIDFTTFQVRWMKKLCDEIIVLFDPDPQAIEQANKLVDILLYKGLKARKVHIDQDPGSMSQEEANYLVKQLIK